MAEEEDIQKSEKAAAAEKVSINGMPKDDERRNNMQLYKLIVAYNGHRFNGFQRQITNNDMNERKKNNSNRNNRRLLPSKRPHFLANGLKKTVDPYTVQDCLEDAMVDWSGCSVKEVCLRFAGRTDKGVSARGQVIAVNLPKKNHGGSGEMWEIRNAINSRLPVDISIEDVQLCQDDSFDPRRDARSKQYSYTIKYRRKVYDSRGNVLPICQIGPNSFRHSLDDPACLWLCPWSLDDSKMSKLCDFLQGQHDFCAFVHKSDRNNGRDHVLSLDVMSFEKLSESTTAEEDAPVVTARFVVESKGFRRSMIRNLVGFCVDVCRGCDDLAAFDWDDLWSGEEEVCAKVRSAPACGLCLEEVRY